MRFYFLDGGRTGLQNLEDLADHMESLVTRSVIPNSLGQNKISIADRGDMMIDFSPTKSAVGEVFKSYDRMFCDFANGKTMRELAAQYWAEGEAIAISKATNPSSIKHQKVP